MKYIYILLFLSMLGLNSCVGQNNQHSDQIIMGFVKGLLDNSNDYDQIIDTYLKANIDTAFLKTHLKYASEELRKRKVDINSIEVFEYKEVSKRYQTIIMDTNELDKVYFVFHKNEFIIPILLENDRIVSFSTMDKGGRKYFMKYK